MRRLLIALVAVTACGTSYAPQANVSPTAAAVSPSSLPSETPAPAPVLGVFYDGQTQKLEVVDSNGLVITSVDATAPARHNAGLPWISESTTRVYFLDATGTVHFLALDGTTGIATHVDAATGQDIGFAVSPDDRKIAVAVLSYRSATSFAGTRMYVEDLAGGSHHVDIYSSSINAEFPIAWTKGRLVVALATPLCCKPDALNPYGAVEYHVVDPTSGHRVVTLCHGTVGPIGPPTTVGVNCWGVQLHWDGTPCCDVGTGAFGILAPDGNSSAWGSPIEVAYGFSLSGQIFVTTTPGTVAGWLDVGYLIYREPGDLALYIGVAPELRQTVRVQGSGSATLWEGTLPTAIS